MIRLRSGKLPSGWSLMVASLEKKYNTYSQSSGIGWKVRTSKTINQPTSIDLICTYSPQFPSPFSSPASPPPARRWHSFFRHDGGPIMGMWWREDLRGHTMGYHLTNHMESGWICMFLKMLGIPANDQIMPLFPGKLRCWFVLNSFKPC